MYMIGGWLGSGTYAAVDVYVLNLGNLTILKTNYLSTKRSLLPSDIMYN